MNSHAAARQRQLFWLVVAIALVGAAVVSVPWRWLNNAENRTVDFRFQLRDQIGGRPEPASVILGVADSSFALAEHPTRPEDLRGALAAMTTEWPWDRSVFAAVVRRLRAAGARAIVFDFIFASETAGDAEFARAIAESGAPVVLASKVQPDHAEGTSKQSEPREVLLAAAGHRVGYTNVFPDTDDDVLRSLTPAMARSEFLFLEPRAGETPLPSLALAAAQALRPGARLPLVSGYIDWTRGVQTRPIEELFFADRWKILMQDGFFRDRVVWVGPLSEVRFKDYHSTPMRRMTGVEVHANALETLLGQGPFQPTSFAATVAWVWALATAGVVVAWASLRVSVQLAIVVAGALGWGALAFGCFFWAGFMLPFVAPVAAWLVAGGGGVGVRFIMEQRERRRLRGVLGRYVSEEVAMIIADQPEEFSQSLRGTRRPVTVLFADLRGFTSWVEKAEPEAFVAQLNEYFGAAVDCVLAQGGTLQKYIGDALLAVWGDTRTAGAEVDTARAVDAALAMQAAVAQLNAAWAGRPDRTPMAIGIGLHHGVAMVGNVGHRQRMEFTVLGDVVNVAARLESANRQLGTTVLVSAAIQELTCRSHRSAPLGRFGLKGRREAVDLFVPLGPRAEPEPDWLGHAEAALAKWTTGDFSAAAAAYGELARLPTPLAEFFQTQAARALEHAALPPPEWKGEHRFDSK